MKKIKFLALLLLLPMFYIGCTKDVIPDPTPATGLKPVKIQFSVVGDESILAYIPNDEGDLILNDIIVPKEGGTYKLKVIPNKLQNDFLPKHYLHNEDFLYGWQMESVTIHDHGLIAEYLEFKDSLELLRDQLIPEDFNAFPNGYLDTTGIGDLYLLNLSISNQISEKNGECMILYAFADVEKEFLVTPMSLHKMDPDVFRDPYIIVDGHKILTTHYEYYFKNYSPEFDSEFLSYKVFLDIENSLNDYIEVTFKPNTRGSELSFILRTDTSQQWDMRDCSEIRFVQEP